VTELGGSARESLENGHIASAIVLTRATLETAAALWFLRGKIETCLKNRAVGDIDEYLMRLLMGSRINPEKPQAVNVLSFVDRVNETVVGFRNNYDILSECAHPNWAGTTGIYATVDMQNRVTAYGRNPITNEAPKAVGLASLATALDIADHVYDGITEMIPEFTILCERNLQAERVLNFRRLPLLAALAI
jgi:hypothetical protein